MKIVIIGASSTIGENLLNYLSRKNIEVVATYKTNKPSKKNNITWKKLDINQNNFEPKYFWGDKSKLNKILKD